MVRRKEDLKYGERIKTGVSLFDAITNGGFKRNSINLLAGGAGSGKTVFALQFLINGCTKLNENGLYLTFEEKREKVYDDMLSFGWDLAKLEKEKKFFFLEYTPEQVKKVLVEGGGLIEAIIEKNDIKRIVIDSISSFALLYQDELTKKEASLALFELIGKWNCTALMTAQAEDVGTGTSDSISAALGFEADSIILLYHFKKKGIRQRAIEILKMRGVKYIERIFPMRIGTAGIEISAKGVVDV